MATSRELIEKRVTREVKVRERKENKILRAAERVFAKKGFDGARMEDIAKAAALPKPNVYYYFKSKKDIYRRIISELHDQWGQAFQHISSKADAKTAIRNYIKAKLEFSRKNPIASKIYAGEIIRGSSLLTKSEKETVHRLTQEKCTIIQQWIDEGKMDKVDPAHFLLIIWSATQFYADFDNNVKTVLGVSRLSDDDFDNAEKTLCQVILRGCGLEK